MKTPLSRGRAAVAGLAAVALLGACNGSPGAAAVVGDTSISMNRVDDLASAYCEARVTGSELGGQPFNPEAGQESRRFVAGLLVRLELARQVAEERDLSVSPAEYKISKDQFADLLDALGDEQGDLASELLDIQSEADYLTLLVGAEELGQDLDQIDSAQAAQAGFDALEEQADSVGVELDPRLGIDPDVTFDAQTSALAVDESDSLSVPVSDEAKPGQEAPADTLPDALLCQ